MGAPTTTREWGRCVGWLDGEHLYLNPEAAYAAARWLGQQSGDPLTVTTSGMLWKRRHERHLLVRHDSVRETLQIRMTVKGRHISVIHLHTSTLTELSRDENLTNPTNRAELGQLWS